MMKGICTVSVRQMTPMMSSYCVNQFTIGNIGMGGQDIWFTFNKRMKKQYWEWIF